MALPPDGPLSRLEGGRDIGTMRYHAREEEARTFFLLLLRRFASFSCLWFGGGEKIERADEQCKHALALFSSSSPNHLNVFSFFAAIQSAEEEEEGHSAGGGGKWFLFTPGKLPEKFGISISERAA